jgi:hypothetical protein
VLVSEQRDRGASRLPRFQRHGEDASRRGLERADGAATGRVRHCGGQPAGLPGGTRRPGRRAQPRPGAWGGQAAAEQAWEEFWSATRPVGLTRAIERHVGQLPSAMRSRRQRRALASALALSDPALILAAWDPQAPSRRPRSQAPHRPQPIPTRNHTGQNRPVHSVRPGPVRPPHGNGGRVTALLETSADGLEMRADPANLHGTETRICAAASRRTGSAASARVLIGQTSRDVAGAQSRPHMKDDRVDWLASGLPWNGRA